MTGTVYKSLARLWLPCRALVLALAAFAHVGCGSPAPQPPPVQVVKPAAPVLPPLLMHLPGIGGKRSIDLAMTRGFKAGGFNGEIQIYDWTQDNPGLTALISSVQNHKESKIIAETLTKRYDKDPLSPIYLTCHSGGGGIAVWALEALPDRVKIRTLVLMSPALSPTYDLSAALGHVTDKAYVFSSLDDVLVLGTGCTLLGTIDGVKTKAAGMVGFTMPTTGNAGQYSKLVPMPYNPAWIQYNDYGNHVGGMTRSFGQMVLAPLVLSGKMPPTQIEPVAPITTKATQ